MIYLELFLTFLKIGMFTFGGGYAMISLIRDDCLANGWLTEGELLNFIAVAESTPGPIAVNMATFVGSSQGGFWGAMLATLGVVLPSFIIILLVATLLTHLLKYAGVKAVLGGIRPAIVGMILATALTTAFGVFASVGAVSTTPIIEWRMIAIFALICAAWLAWKKWKKTPPSPILLILLSGVLGVIFFGV
jgi:chromate transporter